VQWTPGTKLGTYEITGSLGAGGMGEVYRARDTTLGREVAIKVLSSEVTFDAASQGRFEREARALAALNHANVATLYAVERSGDSRALVMELVEGDTLSERLKREALSWSDALAIAKQVAEAIEAAHAKGIVHRDLKPANIKITPAGIVKVLDFGLAKVTDSAWLDAQLPTIEATREGVIVGTVAYMSPQQARGQAVEKDADIWAFGCVLYEMLARRRAFPGETISDIVANVLQREPDWAALPAETPSGVIRLVRRCLAKDPSRRLRDIADARLEIEDALSSAAVSSSAEQPVPAFDSRSRSALLVGVVSVAVAAGVVAGMLAQRARGAPAVNSPTSDVSAFGMQEPPGESLYNFVDPVCVSPDGRRIALVTHGPQGQSRLWLRSLDELEPKRLDIADGAMFPFWSPDGRSLGFLADGQLRTVDVASRSVRSLTPVSDGPSGGTWNRDGTILYVDGTTGLKRIDSDGGTPVLIDSPGPSNKPVLAVAPKFLPDGRHFLYYAVSFKPGESAVMLGDLDSPTRTLVLMVDSKPFYAPPGFLIYPRNGEVVAHRFDLASRKVVGDPVVIGRSPWVSGFLPALSASDTGVLAFATDRTPVTQLTWFDRGGKPLGRLGEPGRWIHVAVAPNGHAVAAERLDMRTGAGVTWTLNVAHPAASRLSLRPGWSMVPVWSPQSDRIALGVSAASGDGLELVTMPSDGSGREETVGTLSGIHTPTDWLPQGRGLVIQYSSPKGFDVSTLAFGRDSKPVPLVNTAFNEAFGKVSPDGRWLAYVSNESGKPEVYVRPLDGSPGRWIVSQTGGSQPRWRRDGQELFFVSETNRLMASAVRPGPAFDSAPPVELPIEIERDLTGNRYMYDVADFGRRFLVIRRTSRDQPPPLTVIVNWPSLVR
jgi:eukaryotic-like serine/threonine-protein kinase